MQANSTVIPNPLCPWRAALYIRLSRDDGDKLESNSVTNQREILREHLKLHPDIVLHDTYIDDGWSGTNFNRPGFQRMMEDIYAGHVNCVAPLGMGRATVIIDGQKRYAACIGGMLSVSGGNVTLVPTTFEWADEIDAARVEASYEKAQRILDKKDASNTEIKLAQARLHRALVRRSVASYK